ncbi:IS66 family insertion sequence element accessory protein TnpA [Halobacillus seohaensis]|uniref:IS66 family insertion sequence element accessory protein TnpB n=1 Tax=Halobacillus seohaensis TaxID=447421 RepID=A0ABW2EP34_9BACI
MSQTDKQGLWEDRLMHFQESGQTAKEWCNNHHINIHTFRYWKREIQVSADSAPSWVAVEVEEEASQPSIHISIGRATIETSEDVCPEHLANVLKVVQAVC